MKTFVIPVKPRTKKNHSIAMLIYSEKLTPIRKGPKIFGWCNAKAVALPSKTYSEFEKACLPFLNHVKAEAGIIDYPVNVQCLFFMETRRRVDLANLLNAIDDAAVKSGLILDDNRDIIAAHDGSRVFYDKNNPRIEITITEMKNYTQWNNTTQEQKTLF